MVGSKSENHTGIIRGRKANKRNVKYIFHTLLTGNNCSENVLHKCNYIIITNIQTIIFYLSQSMTTQIVFVNEYFVKKLKKG